MGGCVIYSVQNRVLYSFRLVLITFNLNQTSLIGRCHAPTHTAVRDVGGLGSHAPRSCSHEPAPAPTRKSLRGRSLHCGQACSLTLILVRLLPSLRSRWLYDSLVPGNASEALRCDMAYFTPFSLPPRRPRFLDRP